MKKNLLKPGLFLWLIISGYYWVFAGNFTNAQPPNIVEVEKVRYLESVYDSITNQKDIVFGVSVNETGVNENLKLDIYSPSNDITKNRPVIVWIHGGGFRPGNDKNQSYIVELAKRFSKKGYVCLSIDYRLRENPRDNPKGTISDAVEDAMKGLEWLRKNSETLNIDTTKIIVGGGSAGGMLSCNLCYNERPNNKDKNGIVGFVNLWGTPDIIWGELDIDKNDPPTIIVHGTADKLVAYENSVHLIKKLNVAGVKNELVTIDGGGHTPVKQMNDFEGKIASFLYELIK